MPICQSCRQPLDENATGTFCPLCGEERSADRRVTLEIKRARFVVNQRCLLRLRVKNLSGDRARLRVRMGVEQVKLESTEAAVEPGKPDEPALFTFAFTPRAAGEFRVNHLSVRVESAGAARSYSPAESDLALRVSATEQEPSGVVYNIQVQEMYGSDIRIDHGPPAGESEPEWRPVPLAATPSAPARTLLQDPTSVPAALFRDAFADWNSPRGRDVLSLGSSHWILRERLGQGERSDVYLADRARFPTERVVLKILRDAAQAARFDREWEILQKLQASDAPGAETFTRLIPEPVARGVTPTGAHAMAFRWASGFRHNVDAVRRAFPQGIDPRVSIWMWRRILEILTFVHKSGVAHGSIVPEHVLVEEGEHGVRLVGYGAPGTPRDDIAMSARLVASLVKDPPDALAKLFRESGSDDAWSVRERVGDVARSLFGAPAFCPLRLG